MTTNRRLLSPFLTLCALVIAACGDDSSPDTTPADMNDAAADGDGSAAADSGQNDTDVTDAADSDLEPADGSADGSGSDVVWVTEPGVAAEGCPIGGVWATQIREEGFLIEGPDALASGGDFVLINDQAAFVIQGLEDHKTYWYYGGTPIDAVALDDCAQIHPEQFGEAGLLAGVPNLGSFTDSTLRGIRADSIEVISDGTEGGEARVRVTGTDDYFWLIELELLARGFKDGSPRRMSQPMGLEVTIDWILRPGSRVLEAEVTYRNVLDRTNPVIIGMVQFSADGTRTLYHAESALSIAGFTADVGIPWIVSTSDTGAWAWAYEGWSLATTNVAGVDALINADTFLAPTQLAAAGSEGDSISNRFFLSVGPTDAHSAIRNLPDVVPQPLVGVPVERVPVAITVSETETGAPVAGARVQLQARQGGNWSVLDEYLADEAGTITLDAVRLDTARQYRWAISDRTRTATEPVVWDGSQSNVALTAGRTARVSWTVVTDNDTPMPAKVVFWQGGRMVGRFFAAGPLQTAQLPPGEYEVDVSRGIEFALDRQTVTLSATEPTTLSFRLPRVINTDGYLNFDGHVHGGPSPDSPVTVPDRIRSLAAEGIEVAVSTDHEALINWEPGRQASGLADWVATVLGEEVTPPLPEHHNAYPFVQDPATVRGSPPDWRGLDIVGLHAAIRERGAEIISLNHPRLGCNYMCIVGYDRLTGETSLEDPTLLGFEEDAELWSWDFDTIEYQNDNRQVFVDPAAPDRTGLFEDWMSFHNLGYPVTAVGVTDVHGEDALGLPRNYFLAPVDSPTEFTDDMLVSAMREGRSVVSTGAFADILINETAQLGDTVTDTDGSIDIDLRIEALPEIDVTHFTVFANCDEVGTFLTTDSDAVIKFDGTVQVEVEEDAHIVVLGFGRELLPRNLPQFNPEGVPRFTTNVIRIDADGDGEFTEPGGKTCSYTLTPPAPEGSPLTLPPRTAWRQSMLEWWNVHRTSLVEDPAANFGSTCICDDGEGHHH